jgi:hypothetical protein
MVDNEWKGTAQAAHYSPFTTSLFTQSLVEPDGIEPKIFSCPQSPAPASAGLATAPQGARVQSDAGRKRSNSGRLRRQNGGAWRDRTDDILLAKQALSQLS